jgi:alpha-L-rhamnosidase
MKDQNEQQLQQERWLQRAETLTPTLCKSIKSPVSLVQPVPDGDAFLRWRMQLLAPANALGKRLMDAGDTIVIDFGEHLTGHVAFSITGEGRGVDAPARLKLIFGEVPAEVAEPFDPYQGFLSRAWLQTRLSVMLLSAITIS